MKWSEGGRADGQGDNKKEWGGERQGEKVGTGKSRDKERKRGRGWGTRREE